MDSVSKANEQALKEAQTFVRKTQQRLDSGVDREASKELLATIQERLNELRHAIRDNDTKKIAELHGSTRELVDEKLGPVPKSTWREYVESIGLAIIFAFVLRGFVIEAFKIPTGSMIPTLEIGDHLFVNKFVYGVRLPFTQKFLTRFSEPKSGDVVVFTFPREEAKAHLAKQPTQRRQCIDRGSLEEEKDFIKRIVGVAGDTVELRDNLLIINDEPVKREFEKKDTTDNYLYPYSVRERETLGEHEYSVKYEGRDDDFGPVKVKDGHVFVMGDNRDHSSDSRCWGQVPIDNIKGSAMIIWWSIGPERVRWGRIGQLIE